MIRAACCVVNSFLLLTLLLNPVASLAAQLEAVTDRTRVGLEESFSLELRASGGVDGEPDLSVLDKDFELLGRSQSSQVQIINSDITRTTVWSLSLLARSAGRKTIPAICVEDDCSAPVVIDVLPAGQSSNGTSGESDLLLEVSAEPDKIWVQSQLLYKVRILTRINFLQASLTEPEPYGVEAVVQKLGDDRNYETERDGVRYRVIERSYAIFPQQSGRLTIPSIRFGAQVADAGRRGYDPFNQRTRQLRRHSKEINIHVLPATDTKGRSWLPANKLILDDDWRQHPPQLTVGEPATRTITLRASGLPSAQLPDITLEIPEGVRSYPDQPNREDKFNEKGMLGTLQHKLALVPTKPGNLRLPKIKIDWWDIQEERWQQSFLPAIDLEVLPETDQPAAVTPPIVAQTNKSKTPKNPQTEKLVAPVTTEPGLWPWLSLTLGIGWFLTLLLVAKGKRSRVRKKKEQKREEESLSLKKARRELRLVLKSGDQAQARVALLRWGASLFPEQRPGNLEELAALCGPPLRRQLEGFNRSLYSRTAEPWDAHEILMATQQAERELGVTKDIDQLPPLYPQE
jgi:hypothetical protein